MLRICERLWIWCVSVGLRTVAMILATLLDCILGIAVLAWINLSGTGILLVLYVGVLAGLLMLLGLLCHQWIATGRQKRANSDLTAEEMESEV